MKRAKQKLPSILAAILLALPALAATSTPAQQLAFPSAEGFGRLSVGGRGGDVYHVTNLNDAGEGSLRDAVSKGPRIVVFDVGGYIELKKVLTVASNITIAGQTAPGDGIATKGYEVSFSDSHDVIARYIRFRQGITAGQDKKSAVNMTSAKNIILDHCSIQFGRWDTVDMNLCQNITIQDSIIGPGVAPQRFGSLCQSDGVTWAHDLFIDNHSRNPKAKGTIQYINNVVYDWGVTGFVGGHSGADHGADLINNYFIAGQDSSAHFVGECKATDHFFQSGNYVDLDKDGKLNGHLASPAEFGTGADAPTLVDASTIKPAVPVTTVSAEDALQQAIADAGDSLHRDSVDQKLIDELKTYGKSGKNIEDPAEIGGFGDIKGGPAIKDVAGTGIPADWATAHGLTLSSPADAKKVMSDGYTAVEQYINSLATSAKSDPTASADQ
jgi:hypothetical protein